MPHYKFDSPLFMWNTYVQSLSTSIGWGGQGGNMSLKLIEDPDPPPHQAGVQGKPFIPRTLKSLVLDWDDCDGRHNPEEDPNHPDCPHDGLYGFHEISQQVGAASYFVYGSFTFGGILQRMQRAESVGGGRTIDVVLESPSKLMDGVQVILGEFNGMTDWFLSTGAFCNTSSTNLNTKIVLYGQKEDGGYRRIYANDNGVVDGPFPEKGFTFYDGFGLKNVYNVFGHLENPISGTFGGSNFNSAGMQCGVILETLAELAVKVDDDDDSNPFGGRMHFMDTEYTLDLSELIDAVNARNGYNFRISGAVKSLNALISEICEAFQLDYFFMVEPEDGWNSIREELDANGDPTGGLLNGGDFLKDAKIVVKVAEKGAPPNEYAIEDYITATRANGDLISSNFGREYADAVSQKLIYGGARTRYQAIPIANCIPIFGQNNSSQFLTSDFQNTQNIFGSSGTMTGTNPRKQISLNLGNKQGGTAGLSSPYKATLMELRMALGGKQNWEIFKTFETMAQEEPNGFNNIFSCPWTGSVAPTLDVLQEIVGGNMNNRDMLETNGNRARKQWVTFQNKRADVIFQAVSNAVNSFVLQQFFVPLISEYTESEQMYYRPPGDYEEIRTWEISDAAFLECPIARDLKFFDGQGRQKSMSMWPLNGLADYSNLGADYTVSTGAVSGQMASTKGSPDKEQYEVQEGIFVVPFKMGAQVRVFDGFTTPDFGLTVLASYFFNKNVPPARIVTAGKQGCQFAIPPDILIPSYACVPQESTRYRFGPWGTVFGSDEDGNPLRGGLNGKAEVIADESLRPETFGSWGLLNQVGAIQATVGVQQQAALETGTIEVHGAPAGNIGERFVTTGPYVTDMSISVDTSGGVKTNYKLSTYTPNFGKLAKYNIDRISRINKAMWTRAKKNRDRVEKRPLPKHKFEKTDFSDGPLQSNRFNADDAAAVKWGVRQDVLVNQNRKGQNQGGDKGDPGQPNF